ncbi:MAG: 2-C-methyl-D-erythritol 4-phosphate cytidylyltransferase [Anaerovoracaceae bacterium]
MVYGVILASGVGKRMGSDIPKQYLEVCNVPIIVYTIKSMLKCQRIDYIYIAISEPYKEYIEELLAKYFDHVSRDKFKIVFGGKERIDTINNVTNALISNGEVSEDDVVIFHDAVRPFVTKQILEDSIDGAREKGATVAGMPAVDTMLVSSDGSVVESIPNRATLFHGQAPDSFRLSHFIKLRDKLTDEQKSALTGTSQFCTYNNVPIYLIAGDDLNFKITTQADLERAETIVNNMEGDK